MTQENNSIDPARVPAPSQLVNSIVYQVSQEDEISLVDLAQVVVKNKRVFYGIFTSIVIVGFLVAFLMPEKYLYSTVIEVGNYKLPDNNGVLGKPLPIESIGKAKTKLERHFVVDALQGFYNNSPDASLPDLKVEAPNDSSILVVSVRGVDGDNAKIALLNQIADELVADHLELSEDILEQLRQKVDLQVLKVEELRAKLESDKQQILLLNHNLLTIDEEEKLLGRQVIRSNEDINNLTKHRTDYIRDTTHPKDAMALLLIDNEIRQIREQRDRLEQKLYIGLVNTKGVIQKKIADSRGELGVTEASLNNTLKTLKRIGGVSSNGVEESVAETQPELLLNLRTTVVVVGAHRSFESINISKVLIIVASLILGVSGGLISCYLWEFIGQVRRGRA